MRATVIGLAVLAFGGGAAAQGTDVVLTNAASRDGVDLSGAWAYSIDPTGDGLFGFHGSEAGFGHRRFDTVDVAAFEREHPDALFEYDMSRSPRTQLPGSWVGHAPEMRHYDGLVWYKREFEADLDGGERAFLRVGAANYRTRLYLNGELVGTHEGGFTPFAFEVTDELTDGTNQVTIAVDSERTEESIPPLVTDWETYGGVTRPIKLVVVPATFVDDAWVRLTEEGMIAASVRLDGADAGDSPVTVAVPELGLTLEGRTGRDGRFEGEAAVPPTLERWSPDDPKLYDVVIRAGDDELAERVGFRTVSVEGTTILLNGEPIFLRGICLHEEEFGVDPSRAVTEAEARALLSEVKQGLNGNFVRLAHYPHAEATVRLADEMGLLVWSEIPTYWQIAWESDEALRVARGLLAESVMRDRNRASVALWSIANETPVSDARNAFLRTLIADVRAMDDTRPVTAALLTEATQEDGTEYVVVTDPLAADLDVLAVNIYRGWYGTMPVDEVSELRWRSDWGKPMILSEFGGGALLGFSDPVLKRRFSVEYQAEIYEETLEMAAGIPFLAGMSPWLLKDFRSPRRQHPVYQQGWNRKGLMSETGLRKPAFDVLAERYREIENAGAEER